MGHETTENGEAIPEPQEDYQKKLKEFIVDIPPLGPDGDLNFEIWSGTQAPAKNPYTESDIKALGVIKTDPRFKKYTGWEHEALLRKWLVDRTTTCNEFVGKCVTAMGYTSEEPRIGRFDIADQLLTRGLTHVWVPADSGAKPEYGDIFRLYEAKPDHNATPTNHMAVSLGVIGSNMHSVDSGQGGPGNGHDIIKHRSRPWKPTSLRGWVSMKALLHADKPLPYWLGGWWEVEEGPYDVYYYYFGAGGKVSFSSTRPLTITALPVGSTMVGSCIMKGMYSLELTWRSNDGVEKMSLVHQDPKKRIFVIEGRTSRNVDLKATRLLPKNPDTW